jgi:MFS superfamily sulfate permease-like transporter
MLAAIGIIIFLKQIPHAFGYDADFEGDLGFAQADGHNTFSELFHMLNFISPGATLVAAISLTILILWERPFMKKLKVFQIVQGPIVAVSVGILLNVLLQRESTWTISSEHTVSLPVAGSLKGFFTQFTFPDFTAITDSNVWIVAVTIAIVASLETLLCVEATDKLDPQKRVTPTNRELLAQGVGNSISGLIGGLPVTQVIVRSSANIQSGGRTKSSAIFHGIMILFCVMIIPAVLNLIPLASLAAILLVVGYKLAKPQLFREMFNAGQIQFIPFLATVLGIVFTDLLVGITIGMSVGVFFILFENFKNSFFVKQREEKGQTIIELSEHVTFLNKASIQRVLNELEVGQPITIDASKSVFMHPDVKEIIDDFIASKKHLDNNITYIKPTQEQSLFLTKTA